MVGYKKTSWAWHVAVCFFIGAVSCAGEENLSKETSAGTGGTVESSTSTEEFSSSTMGSGGSTGSTDSGGNGGTTTTVCETDESWTVGLLYSSSSVSPGYTLLAPLAYSTTYLIDNCGQLVHSWEGTSSTGNVVYLLETGELLRTEHMEMDAFEAGGSGGRILRMDWDGTPNWTYEYATTEYRQHHDIEMLPNGNVLILAWELVTESEAIQMGRDPDKIKDGELWIDHVVEVTPVGDSDATIVWEWHAKDHLVQDIDSTKDNFGTIEKHPELADINYGNMNADWLHTNSVEYNAELDQIALSIHNLNEVWVIDHSTTTEEAAGHTGGNSGKGGDILYRWGNPEAYGAGTESDRYLYGQHDAHWIAPGLPRAGNMLIFNNGPDRPDGKYSTIEEIELPVEEDGSYTLETGQAYGPTETTWNYTAPTPTDFYASNISGSQRQPNGNTLICSGSTGVLFEVTDDGTIVWKYVNPVTQDGPVAQGDMIEQDGVGPGNGVFRAYRYPLDYAAFDGKDLTPQGTVELQ